MSCLIHYWKVLVETLCHFRPDSKGDTWVLCSREAVSQIVQHKPVGMKHPRENLPAAAELKGTSRPDSKTHPCSQAPRCLPLAGLETIISELACAGRGSRWPRALGEEQGRQAAQARAGLAGGAAGGEGVSPGRQWCGWNHEEGPAPVAQAVV